MLTRKLNFSVVISSVLLPMLFTVQFNTAKAQTSTAEPEKSLPSFKFGGFLQQQFDEIRS